MKDSCEICGRSGADILCTGCGRTVCDSCYNGFRDLCVQCVPAECGAINRRALSTTGLRMLGLLITGLGIALASIAQAIGADEKGLTALLPSMFENGELVTVASFTATLLTFFIFTSLLPWYIISKRSRMNNEFTMIGKEALVGRRDNEALEYIITTELPKELMNSIFIEADEEEVYLMSTKDEDFFRSYSMPEGFEVGEIDYDYEDNYLIMKLILKRST